jgi:hypothetical protein
VKDLKAVRAEVDHIGETQLKMERFMRRSNLMFRGIPENDSESCTAVIKEVLKDKIDLDRWDEIVIDTAYRLGKLGNMRFPRPILVNFMYLVERGFPLQKIYQRCFKEGGDD